VEEVDPDNASLQGYSQGIVARIGGKRVIDPPISEAGFAGIRA